MCLANLLKVFASLFDAELVEYKKKEDPHEIMGVYQLNALGKKAFIASLRNNSFIMAREDAASNDLVRIKKWIIDNS